MTLESIGKLREWDGKPFVEYAEHVAKEIHGEAFALLEGCDEPDFSAIDAICAACEDVMRITGRWKRGESQDEFTTSERATLTAEQVRKAVHGHYKLRMVLDVDGFDVPQVAFDWQAIADELNAALCDGECEMETENDIEDMCGEHYVYFTGWTCSECGNQMTSMYESDAPNFCPNCGKAVKR